MLLKLTKYTLSILLFLVSGLASATLIVAPNANETLEGDSNNAYPFNGSIMDRYQQVYSASEFGGITGIMDQILFRIEGGNSSFSSTYDIQITLSHTSAGPATLSSTFADNLGSDAILVLNDSSYTVTGTGSTVPNPFNVIFDIDDVFTYNGVDNLLLDISIFSGSSGVQFDATSSSSLGRIFSESTNDTTGIISDRNYGLVTAFEINTVPEPSIIALFGAGLFGVGLVRRRKPRI